MRRRISAVLTVALAVCAGSGAGAATSSATELTAESYSNIYSGTTIYSYLTLEGGTVECTTTFQGIQTEASSEFSAEIWPGLCQAFGFIEATTTTTGCELVFHLTEASEPFEATMDVSCEEESAIVITAGTCEVEIGSQTELSTIELWNGESGEVKLGPNIVETIAYTVTKDGFLCPFSGTGKREDGSFQYEFAPMYISGSWPMDIG